MKISNIKILLISAAALLLIAAAIALLVFSSTAYQKPIKFAIDALNGSFESIEKSAPEEYWTVFEREQGFTPEETVKEMEKSHKASREFLEKQYGENAKFSVSRIEKKKKLEAAELEEITSGLKKNYKISPEDVKKAYEVGFVTTVKGDEKEQTENSTTIVVNIKGKWYICSSAGRILPGSLY